MIHSRRGAPTTDMFRMRVLMSAVGRVCRIRIRCRLITVCRALYALRRGPGWVEFSDMDTFAGIGGSRHRRADSGFNTVYSADVSLCDTNLPYE